MIDAALNICNKIWQTGEWHTLVITLPKKGNSDGTIAQLALLVMLKMLLNRLKEHQSGKIIAEEEAGFRPAGSRTTNIFST